MCGIFGSIGVTPMAGNPSEVLRHRGPDGGGVERFTVGDTPWSVQFGHRRLAIIDLSPLGRQPMSNEDGTIWITFNGEIFNFPALRDELIRAGHQFRSRTDTEVIVHGYEQWGDAVVERLRGQFAFALWDRNKRRVLLSRDRLGEKPLFYYHKGGNFIFSSEIKAILATGRVPVEPDLASIDEYLTYLYFPPPRTAFRGIRKLAPSMCLSVEIGQADTLSVKQWEYWDAATACQPRPRAREADYLEEARHLIRESTRMRLISDVPVGISLSGGLDSSTITAFAAETGSHVQTFSVGFPNNPAFDETEYSGMVARSFKTDHHVLQPEVDSAAHLTTVIRHFDEPFGNPTAILQFLLTRGMRQHVTVALAGDGGDELFGGYERYRGAALARMYRKMPAFLTRDVIRRLAGHMHEDTSGNHGYRRLREFAEFAWQDEVDMYVNWVGYNSESEKRAFYAPEMARVLEQGDPSAFLRSAFQRGSGLDPISRLGYVDLQSFLACNCLEYGDRMSMANGLEVRCPFTDHKLVEFALSLPPSAKVRGLKTKWIMRKAMEGILPQEVLTKRKIGFNPPTPTWLGQELRSVVGHFLSREAVVRRGLFLPDALEQIQKDHYSARRDNTFKIWSLLMLELWFRMVVDGQDEEAVRMETLELIERKPAKAATLAS